MAKYILNRTSKGPKVVNCAVLDENVLSETYTVRFDNGMIRDVDKRKIVELDRLDEGILDRLKSFGKKLWDNIVKVGKYIYFTLAGRPIAATSPVNTMVAAREINGLTFIPSEQLAQLAEEQGIDAQEVIDEPEDEDETFIEASNNVLKNMIIEFFQSGAALSNPMGNPAYDDVRTYYESKRNRYSRRARLYEGKKSDETKMEHKTFKNVNTEELRRLIVSQYNAYRKGAAMNRSTRPIPYCIWGAPGVGKTQILASIIDDLRDININANMIGINAQAMRKDDWALPGHKTNFKTAVNAEGKAVQLAVDTAVELPKSWLPAWDPNDVDEANGITEEVLDDIANGGDGSGNGQGGFFFIDELSRIAPDVNNVIMTLLQSREFQGKLLGSKWMFVAAANRSGDLGGNNSRFTWDSAQTDRFLHVNFVPTFEEWCEWAESPIRGTNEPHIEPIIVEFLKEYRNIWYNAAMRAEEDDDKVASTLAPRGRTWEVITKAMRELMDSADPDLEALYKKYGIPIEKKTLSVKDTADIMRMQAGNKAADIFAKWGEFDAVFTAKNSKDVWQNGENAAIPFTPHAGTISKAVEKILANPPSKTKVSVPGQNYKKIPITPQELENVVKYILKCVDQMDQRMGGASDPVLKAVQEKLVTMLMQAPYYIDLQNAGGQDIKTYAKAIIPLYKRLKSTENTIFGS